MAPLQEQNLKSVLQENRRGDSRSDYYAEIDRLVGGTPSPLRKRTERELFTPTKQTTPQEGGMSIGGFGENILRDGYDFLKGILDAVIMSWPRAVKSGYDLVRTPGALDFMVKNPSVIAEGAWNTGKAVASAISEPYREHPGTFWYHRPVGTLADALFVLSAGGGSIAKMGRMAGSAKLEAAGRALAESPGRMLRGVEDTFLKHVARIEDPEKWRLTLGIKGEERGAIPAKVKADMETAGNSVKALTDEEASLFHRARTQGISKAELAAAPKVAEALERYRSLAENWKFELKQRHLLSEQTAQRTLENKYAAEVYGTISKETRALAREAIAKAEVKPIYGPSYIEKTAAFDAADFFVQPSKIRTGKVGFLEKFKGAPGAIQDPRIYVPRAIQAFRDVEANLRFIERVLQEPTLLKAVKPGEAGKAVQVQERGVFGKYFEDKARAKAAYIRDVIANHGIDKAAEIVLGNKGTRKELYQISTLVGDPTIRRIISMEFSKVGGGPGMFLRAYDRILNLFKASATTLNPKWYTGNVVGDGILSVIAGVTGGDWKMSRRLLDYLPPHLRRGMGTVAREAGQIDKLQALPDFVGAVDNATRSGIITSELAKKLKVAGKSFYETEEALRPIISAPFNLSEAQVRIQLLEEQIARSVPAIRKIDHGIERRTAAIASSKPKLEALRSQKPTKARSARYEALKHQAETWNKEIRILEAQKSAAMADYRATWSKLKERSANVPELQAQAAQFREAERAANAFIGNYNSMDPIEQAVFRRIVPFYTWTKAMSLLAFRLPFIRPGAAFMWDKFASAMGSMAGDDELPEWLAGYFPVMVRQNGDTVWARLAGWNPASGVKTSSIGDVTVPNILAFWEANPFIATGYKLIGGKTVFDAGSVPYGEPMVSVGNGDVYEFSEDGSLRKTIPQPPLVSTIAHMFPSTQLVEQLIQPYKVAEGNIPIVWPKPVLNPDGSIKYPRELWEMLPSIVGAPKIMQRSKADLQNQERARVRRVVEGLRGLYHRSDPETKAIIEKRLQEYADGRYRKISAK